MQTKWSFSMIRFSQHKERNLETPPIQQHLLEGRCGWAFLLTLKTHDCVLGSDPCKWSLFLCDPQIPTWKHKSLRLMVRKRQTIQIFNLFSLLCTILYVAVTFWIGHYLREIKLHQILSYLQKPCIINRGKCSSENDYERDRKHFPVLHRLSSLPVMVSPSIYDGFAWSLPGFVHDQCIHFAAKWAMSDVSSLVLLAWPSHMEAPLHRIIFLELVERILSWDWRQPRQTTHCTKLGISFNHCVHPFCTIQIIDIRWYDL